MTELTTKKRTARDLLRVLFRRRYLFFLGAALFAIVVLIAGHYMPLKYTGQTTFQRRTDPAAAGTGGVGSFDTPRLTLRWDISNYASVARAAEELNLIKGERTPDGKLTARGELQKQELVNELRRHVHVRWDIKRKEIDQVSVRFTHPDPELAERMPNTLAKNYIDQISQFMVDRLDNSRRFLEKLVKAGSEETIKLEDKKFKFEADHADAIFDSPGQIRDQILQTSTAIDVLRLREKRAKAKMTELEALVTEWEKAKASSRPVKEVIVPNPKRLELENQLEILAERLINLKINMKEKHPTIVAIRERMAFLKSRIEQMPEEIVKEKVIEKQELPPDRRRDLDDVRQELRQIQNKITNLKARLVKLDEAEKNFSTTRRQYLALTNALVEKEAEASQWAKRLRQVRLALAAELNEKRTQLNTVQAAQKPIRPSSPSLWRIVAMGVLGGLAFGAALVLVANILDRSISTTEDAAKHFNIPVHGVIGEILTAQKRGRRRMVKWLVAPTVSVLTVLVVGLCMMSIILRLQYPREYARWRVDRIGYLSDWAAERTSGVLE